MVIGCTYLYSSFLCPLCSNLERLVTRIPEGIFSIISLCSLRMGIMIKWVNTHVMVSKLLVLGHKFHPWETFKMCFGEVVSPPTQTCVRISQDKASTTRSTKFMIDMCIYNLPFKSFRSSSVRG